MATSYSAETDRENGKDYISELPDDILVTFISPMGIKEAAKTSIISKRWRSVWAKRWTHLDFNHLVILPETDPDVENIDSVTACQKSKYINWVNQVVDLHCIEQIDTFRVCFEFDSNDAHHIHKWVKFALSKKVKYLELNLVSYEHECVYSIGLDILKPPSLVDSGIRFLKSLHFCKIDVDGDFLEYLLSHCSLLERIHIEGSQTLARWKVADLSCKLKQLIIRHCHNLEELEIDAVNLIHLECNDIKDNANVVFNSMPMLVEATFGWGYFLDPSDLTYQHFSHPLWAQISKLSLEFPGGEFPTGVLPTFCNLKQLNMKIDARKECDFVAVTRFLMACPVLREFKLEIEWFNGYGSEAYEMMKLDRYGENEAPYNLAVAAGLGWDYFSPNIEQTTHPNLELLKVVGFEGADFEVDFILFVAVLASNLETIICDLDPDEKIIEVLRSRAAKLAKLIPPKISFVII